MPTSTEELDRTAPRSDAPGRRRKASSNPKLVARLLRMPSATETCPDGRPARMQRAEAVEVLNKIMAKLFPDVDLATANGGLFDEREFGRYQRGEVLWPSRYRRAAFRKFFGVDNDRDLGFYHKRTLEPVVDDIGPDDAETDGTATVSRQAEDLAAADHSPPEPRSGRGNGLSTPDTAVRLVSDGASPWRSSTLDVGKAHPARRYNYWLGGKDHFQADRASGDAIAQRFPWVRKAALANRAFLGRAVDAVAQGGVRQFLDIGTGLPAPGNTHEIAQQVAPESRVLYVDNDPLVGAHARALTVGDPAGYTAYIEADLRRPEQILEHPDFAKALDLRRPVGIVLAAVLHFIPDLAEAQRVVRILLDAAAPGSFLIVSHGTPDFVTAEEAAAYEQMYASGAADARTRTKDDIASFFTGLDVLEPGFVAVSDWRPVDDPNDRPPPEQVSLYGVVGRLP